MSGLLALTLGLGLSGTAFAAQDFSKKSPGYSSSFDTQMTKVMNSGDFEAWKALVMSKTGKVDPLITKDNFPKFAEAWRLAKEGKIKEANAIRKELGLKTRPENASQSDLDKDNDNDVSKVTGSDPDNDGQRIGAKDNIKKAQNKRMKANKVRKNKIQTSVSPTTNQ